MIIPLTQPTARATGPPYTWAGPTDLNPHVGQDDLPAAVQASNGTLWIAWQTFRFSTTRPDIMYTTLTNGVTGSIARLTSTGFNTSPTLAQQSGVITLLWSQQKTVTFTIYYETFSAPSTWSSPKNATVISNSYNDTGPAATTTTDGTLWLFWQRANQSCTSSCIQTKQIYYKTMKAGTWSVEKRANNLDANWNSYPSAVVTKDGLTRLAWTKGDQGTTQSTTFYKTYNGTSVSSETQITSPPSGFGDQRPSMIQDRNGTMWLFWSRTSLTAPQFVLFDKFSTNAGQSLPASETKMLT